MRISDWSSDVCSSDLLGAGDVVAGRDNHVVGARLVPEIAVLVADIGVAGEVPAVLHICGLAFRIVEIATAGGAAHPQPADRAGRPRIAALFGPACLADGQRQRTRDGEAKGVSDREYTGGCRTHT